MSAPLINRSLTTIRTELEFLYDSEIIDEPLYNKLLAALPQKYSKDMKPWGIEKIGAGPAASIDSLSNQMEKAQISKPEPAPSYTPAPAPEQPPTPKTVGFCRALYAYQAQESDDLSLAKDEKVAVLEHLSEDWWKGYRASNPSQVGVFPSNYVTSISEKEFNSIREAAPPPQSEKQHYSPPNYSSPTPSYNQYNQYPPQQYQPPPQQHQPSYSEYPPPSTNYYQQPQQQQQQQQQPQEQDQQQSHPHMRKFGSKLGNAAIFGAGATIGSDIVNSIF